MEITWNLLKKKAEYLAILSVPILVGEYLTNRFTFINISSCFLIFYLALVFIGAYLPAAGEFVWINFFKSPTFFFLIPFMTLLTAIVVHHVPSAEELLPPFLWIPLMVFFVFSMFLMEKSRYDVIPE